jgi:hypothetical protein
VEVLEAIADGGAHHQDAVGGFADDGGDGKFEVGGGRFSSGEAAGDGRVAPEDVALVKGVGVDLADFAVGGDEAVGARGDGVGGDAEEHIARQRAIGDHRSDE